MRDGGRKPRGVALGAKGSSHVRQQDDENEQAGEQERKEQWDNKSHPSFLTGGAGSELAELSWLKKPACALAPRVPTIARHIW